MSQLKDEIQERMKKTLPTRVFSYIHGEGRIGVLLEIESDTDFALRNELLQQFAHEVCLQIASMDPVSVDATDCELRACIENSSGCEVNVPHAIRDKVIAGKMKKWDKDNLLLKQPWVKDNKQTIGGLLEDLRGKLGENTTVLRFERYGD